MPASPPGLLWDGWVSSLPAETTSGFVDPPPPLGAERTVSLTEWAESLTELAGALAEGRPALEPGEDDDGVGAALVGGLAGALGKAGTGNFVGGAAEGIDGLPFTGGLIDFAADSTVLVAFSTSFADAAGTPKVSIEATAKVTIRFRIAPGLALIEAESLPLPAIWTDIPGIRGQIELFPRLAPAGSLSPDAG